MASEPPETPNAPDHPDLSRYDPRRVARLLDPALADIGRLAPEESRAVLEYLLDSPVVEHLGTMHPAARERLRLVSDAEHLTLRTLRDVLIHPLPPIEHLRLVKEHAKACRQHPESDVPDDVSAVLYLAAVAAARTRWRQRLSTQPDAAFAEGLRWALGLAWLTDAIRDLLQQALGMVQTGIQADKAGHPDSGGDSGGPID